jgi:hypothetical protein
MKTRKFTLIMKIYRWKKELLICLVLVFAFFLLAGGPCLINIAMSNGQVLIDGNLKTAMLGGIATFLMFLGFLGFYFWTRTDYIHYHALFVAGTILIFTSGLGLQILWNFGNS